jgi:tRNA pseudouridine32 synthase/23S rRNA pseudouridine746 synthase
MFESEQIIFEDENLIFVFKSSGVSYHNDNAQSKGFFNSVQDSVGHKIYSVHRLDKDTSGLIVFAKNTKVQKDILNLFKNRKIKKTYFAISDKKPKKKQGTVKGDLKSTRNGNYKLTREITNPSITKFISFKSDNKFFFIFSPKTGFTHQLRVVCKSLGSPIIGDTRYGGSTNDKMLLHAYRLEFKLNDKNYDIKVLPDSKEYQLFSHYFNEAIK